MVDENISQTSQILPDMMPVEMWAGMMNHSPLKNEMTLNGFIV